METDIKPTCPSFFFCSIFLKEAVIYKKTPAGSEPAGACKRNN